jgi:hypothetical protein
MRLSTAWITGILATALCLYAHGQNTASKDAQINEAKGMPPRAAATDYQAQAQAGKVTIAAEFLGHSVPRAEGPLSTEDYVVIETAFFGSPEERLKLSIDDFSLRINGKKAPLSSQPFGLVAKSLKDPQWSPPEAAETKSKTSIGNGSQSDSNMPPPPVHVPIELQRAMARHLQSSSLPEGERTLPQAGLIYFQYRGKTQSIRSLELIYTGPAGKATLPLQP